MMLTWWTISNQLTKCWCKVVYNRWGIIRSGTLKTKICWKREHHLSSQARNNNKPIKSSTNYSSNTSSNSSSYKGQYQDKGLTQQHMAIKGNKKYKNCKIIKGRHISWQMKILEKGGKLKRKENMLKYCSSKWTVTNKKFIIHQEAHLQGNNNINNKCLKDSKSNFHLNHI